MTPIVISKAEVFKEARRTIENLGKHSLTKDGKPLYNLIAAWQEDEAQLERWFQEGCSDISDIDAYRVKTYTAAVGDVGDFTIEWDLPHFKEVLHAALRQDIFSYLVNRLISQWLLINNITTEFAKYFAALSEKSFGSIKVTLYARNAAVDGSAVPTDGGEIGGDVVAAVLVGARHPVVVAPEDVRVVLVDELGRLR
ncbi:MAG: hypothetical protein HUK08_09260, partial [Bacteroidaceae bacterium]|nr:hypothetical protein [Bacteroidaceae bacterium]